MSAVASGLFQKTVQGRSKIPYVQAKCHFVQYFVVGSIRLFIPGWCFEGLWDMGSDITGSANDHNIYLSLFKKRGGNRKMFKTLKKCTLPAIAMALMALTDMATSTSTFCHWGEPDCPEELLK